MRIEKNCIASKHKIELIKKENFGLLQMNLDDKCDTKPANLEIFYGSKLIRSFMGKLQLKLALIVLIFSVATIYENNLSVLFFSFLWLIFGFIIIKISFNKQSFSNSFDLFILFYLVYYCFSFIVYKTYIHDPFKDYFLGIDSITFYGFTDEILKKAKSIPQAFDIIGNTFTYSGITGYLYAHYLVGYVANLIGTNSYFIQQLAIVFFTSLIPVFLYNVALYFLSKREAVFTAILYGFLGYIFVYSSTLLRDIHVSLLFVMAFYIIFSKKTIGGILFLVLLNYVVYWFRVEHGIFFLSFIGYYTYAFLKEKRKQPIKFLPIILLSIFVLSYLITNSYFDKYIDTFTNTTTRYASFSEVSADPSGLGRTLFKLPPVIKEVVRAAFSQIQPFPISAGLQTTGGVIKYLAFPVMISSIFWITVWAFIIYGFRKKRIIKSIPADLFIIFILSVLFIIGASSGSGDVRRIMAVYPIILVVSAKIFFQLTPKKCRKIFQHALFIFLALHILYFFLKS